MKEVYIPTMDELYLIQEMTNGSFTYKYMLCKVIEALVIDAKIDTGKGILERTHKYFRENPQIATAIGRMYPEEIVSSQYAINDIALCRELIQGNIGQDCSIYSLDNLTYFQNGLGVNTNYFVVKEVIEILSKKLPSNPQYRFEYKEPNSLLDNIFSCKTSLYDFDSTTAKNISIIEPANALRLDERLFDEYRGDYLIKTLKGSYGTFIDKYSSRYGMETKCFPEYFRQDILTNPDDNVKRLQRYLDRHKRKYQ